MLEALAQRLAQSTPRRHLLFLAATLFAVAFMGYHFGTFDQSIHIPFLKKYADPTLYPGDQFLDLRLRHFSYFWLLFLPVYRLGLLEPALFAIHLLATYATFWSLWNLSMVLFRDPLVSLIGLAALIFPHMGFSGFPVIEFSLLNRTFVLPFLLLSLMLYLKRQYLLAFLLAGLLYNLHAVSVHFLMVMYLFNFVFEFRQVGMRRISQSLVAFLLGALPVLIWRRAAGPVDFSLRPEWLSVIALGTFYHLFYLVSRHPHLWVVLLSGLSTLALFLVGRQAEPAGAHDRTMTRFVIAILIILATQMVVTYWLPATIVVQSQIMRAGLFLQIFGYLYFARYVAAALRARTASRLDLAALAGAYIFAPFPFLPLALFAVRRALGQSRAWSLATAGASLVVCVAGIGVAVHYRLWHPGVYVYARPTAWYQVQVWARDNTPKDAVFIVPPERWWLFESDWRVFSERSAVATHAELLEAAFAPEYLEVWEPRFEAVAPGALARFDGNIYDNIQIIDRAYAELTEGDFERIARTYGASYVVVEQPGLPDCRALYQNEQFEVCDLRQP